MIPERVQGAINRLRHLPAVTPAALKALRCLDNPDYSAEELRQILLSD
jgi:hypothetical protein